ncbi:hypothetical protein [Hymenobacter ruricola]|uniref:DUF4136 domain-containing protein n=1 Tax=Hymenobacter ruricola TaxID=2791023 RepID=A0ABS0I3U6_9BACT|nr:hypothetical protein [Hymenobacter ruricola]MBF9221267.1 hypothetical protein [Hymenobacter ruricola]
MPRPSLLAALAGWLLPLSACQSDADRYPAVTTGAAQPPVEAVLPLPMQTVRARLRQRLQSTRPVQAPAHPEYGPQFAQFSLATNETQRIDYLFRRYDRFNSSDEVPMSTAFHAPATVTTALLAYLALPVAARAPDLYLSPTPRWPVPEYVSAQGQPLPYTCDYLLHLRAVGADSTGLEIIAIDSNVIDGTRFGIKNDRDGLGWPRPGRVPRYRDVRPSLTDQQQVLSQLVKLALTE